MKVPADLPEAVFQALTHVIDAAPESFGPSLDAVCARWPDLEDKIRTAVEAMVKAMRALAPTRADAAPLPDHIGPFHVLTELGSGGMGTVYLAEQRQPVWRRVALKLIKLGMDTRAVLARFEAERQVLALMEHPSIAKVYEAGATHDGRPYFAMEYVKGTRITRYCDDNCLPVEERLLLFRQVCSGVQHAHQKGVIHRDLTPNNLLVTEHDGKPVVKIIDFGLARATDHRLTERTLFTAPGVLLGTPEYMSPEQAGLNGLDVDIRSDVYTLGVVLYEMLTGALPFSSDELRAVSFDEMCAVIRTQEPAKPSTKISKHHETTAAIAKLRRTQPDKLLRRLRGDLDWIVLKCLEKDRTRRYETVSQLAEDVQRHLDDEPVLARAPSVRYRLAKLARRHRRELVAATAVLVALVGGLALALFFWRDATQQAAEAKRQGAIANAQASAAEEARAREAATAREASDNAALLANKVREFNLLAADVHLRRALAAEQSLYPPWPGKDGERIRAMRRWLEDDVARLLAMTPVIEDTVRVLRARSLAPTAEEVEPRRTYRFPEEAQSFLHDTLCELQDKLAALAANERKAVQQRLAWAERIDALTRGHPRAVSTWDEARVAIAGADGVAASKLYGEQPIELVPQTGLVPIGMNPATLLWEFYELRSAWDGEGDPAAIAIPQHIQEGEQKGHIAVGEETGIVFVLLPGATFTMGAQCDDPDGASYDPHADPNETPHRVTLAPFFLARHELTNGQWQRLCAKEAPSWHRKGQRYPGDPSAITDAHPVELVDWAMAAQLLRHHGLALPTEAQWEYGCRAGTTTPWWTGQQASSLAGSANVLDQAAERESPQWGRQEGDFDDGWCRHAPVGSYRPNPFGLFDTHGNVWEWCADWGGDYALPARAGDGLRQVPAASTANRMLRGGSHGNVAGVARCANRSGNAPTIRNNDLGLRPARPVLVPD